MNQEHRLATNHSHAPETASLSGLPARSPWKIAEMKAREPRRRCRLRAGEFLTTTEPSARPAATRSSRSAWRPAAAATVSSLPVNSCFAMTKTPPAVVVVVVVVVGWVQCSA